MAEDSDGVTTVVTCEGDLSDPGFGAKFERLLERLRGLLGQQQLSVRKLEPWNSVRVTLAVPREAAQRLRQLANEGSQQLRALGILSVQVEGDQVISLRIAGRFGQEAQEIVLRTPSQDGASTSSSTSSSDGGSNLTRILTAGVATAAVSQQQQQPTQPQPQQQQQTPSMGAATAAAAAAVAAADSVVPEKVQFRSPNVICPTDTKVPPPPSATARSYSGPFPFASMTHAAQAIHSRENNNGTQPPYTQPPPPYPNKGPNVSISSPLLVNLLQNDGSPVPGKKDTIISDSSSSGSAFAKAAAAAPPQQPPVVARPPPQAVKPPQVMVPQPSVAGPAPPPQLQLPPNRTTPNAVNINPQYSVRNFQPQPNTPTPVAPFQQQPQQPPTLQQQPPPPPQYNANPPPYPRPPYRPPTTWQQHPHPFPNVVGPSTLTASAAPPPTLSVAAPPPAPVTVVPAPTTTSPSVDNLLSNITPSLTDLAKADLDLDSLLEQDLTGSPLPDLPETLTSSGKRRQFLINPLTGDLEAQPSSESEPEDAPDVFNDLHSPDHNSGFFSDDDTCSTTVSRKFDTTDQSDSETTVRSNNSDNSTAGKRSKSGKNRDRNRDSPSLKAAKASSKELPTEKIKLRLKLEKSEPVSPAYKVDVSFINTQAPKRAAVQQGSATSTTAPSSQVPSAGEELRVPPLHISLRGRNSIVINNKKEKRHAKLNPDGALADGVNKKSNKLRKTADGVKLKKLSKDLANNSDSLDETAPSGVAMDGGLKSGSDGTNMKSLVVNLSDVNVTIPDSDDLSQLNFNRKREPPGGGGGVGDVTSDVVGAVKKSSKKPPREHREQNLLTGGHLIDKLHKKPKSDDKISLHKLPEYLNARLSADRPVNKKDKLRGLETRRGSDSDLAKGMKRHGDSNGLLHGDKKRRLSQSDGRHLLLTESQGLKSVKEPPVLGSTNVGTVTGINLSKLRKEKGNGKDLNRTKSYVKALSEKRQQQQVALPTGEIDMEAKFKQRLLEDRPVPRTEKSNNNSNRLTSSSTTSSSELTTATDQHHHHHLQQQQQQQQQQNHVAELVQTLTDSEPCKDFPEKPDDTRQDAAKCNTPDRKDKEIGVVVVNSRRLDEKQDGRSPNSGGQGEDSGIESMDALSEKSPNQASQSPHSHTEIVTKNEVTDLMDIEAQLAKMEGLTPLNGELLLKKDLNENAREQTTLEECCNKLHESIKQGNVSLTKAGCSPTTGGTAAVDKKPSSAEVEISLVPVKCEVVPKEEDLDPIPVRITPPLYTYSNPEKQSRDSESPMMSDMDSDNSDSNSSETAKSKMSQSAVTVTRSHRKLLDPKKSNKSLLEQLLIEIPAEQSLGSPSPAASKSSVRTRASSKLNSPESSKSEISINSPVPSSKTSPKLRNHPPATMATSMGSGTNGAPNGSATTAAAATNNTVTSAANSTTPTAVVAPTKRRRQESESSTEDGRGKKSRKCSENAAELIKVCMGVDNNGTGNNGNGAAAKKPNVTVVGSAAPTTTTNAAPSATTPMSKTADESSDSDEPLIEVAGKVRQKTNKVKAKSPKTGVGTRRSVRATRSKPLEEDVRRKTRSAVSETEGKRRRNSRDGK